MTRTGSQDVCRIRAWIGVLCLAAVAGCGGDEDTIIGKVDDNEVRLGLYKDTYTDAVYGYQVTGLPRDTWEVAERQKRSQLKYLGRPNDWYTERLVLRRSDEGVRITVAVEDLEDFRIISAANYKSVIIEALEFWNELGANLPTEPDLSEDVQNRSGTSGVIFGFKDWWYVGMYIKGRRAYRIQLTPDIEDDDDWMPLRATPEHLEALRALMLSLQFI